ncbi:unnamed protein product [Fusarium fujikuroi]|uniref:Heterokaryon incompatibility domain-containing protein n=1 Tax=Fusarium fujikuroi TaxID=5127 RepID=A0A9Q9RQE3_FUSFU|nr:unnamed protein product [Fusarium fujikuroi]VTT81122.1 unnamed protein product [Fusarium fujikuroi]VZI19697.1 unnamed protein product [Fusarium fujikuroi]
MQLSLPFLLPIVLLSQVIAAQNSGLNTLPVICAGVKEVSTCKIKVIVPNGIKVNMRTIKVPTWNKCKSRVSATRSCPTLKKPLRRCKVWTCIPGWEKKSKQIPSSLTILTKEVDLCDEIRRTLGRRLGDNFIKSSEAICGCFNRLQNFATAGTFTAMSIRGEINTATTKVADDTLSIEKVHYSYSSLEFLSNTCKCFGKVSLPILNNKVDIANAIKTIAPWVIAQAKDIDLSVFQSLARVVAACQAGNCNANSISAAVNSYLAPSFQMMEPPIKSVLVQWDGALSRIEESVKDINEAADSLASNYDIMRAEFDSSKQKICEELNRCDGQGVPKFLDRVDEVIEVANTLWPVRGPLDVPSNRLGDRLADTVQVRKDIRKYPEAASLVSMIKQGKFKKISDIFLFMPIVQRVPELAKQIKMDLSPLQDVIKQYKQPSGDAHENVWSLSWSNIIWPDTELTSDSPEADAALIAELDAIDELVRNYLSSPLLSYSNGMFIMDAELRGFSVVNETMPRCAFCRAFTIDQDRFYLEFHPNLASLKKSAGDGCDFCHLCWIGFQREWAPSEIETVLKGEVPEGVTKFEPGIWIYVHFTDYSPTLTQPRIIASCGRYNPITSVKESSHGLSYINLAVYGKEGTAASSRTPGRICTAEYEPDSYITLIRRFLERCTKSHQACGADETYEMPTRVIDVGNAKQGDLPRLIVTGQSMKEKYLALSYCWGPGKDTFTLNHKTMEGMLKSIDESRLVAAHGDTIALARQLGIRYIWIDALCIIQGDKDDWERESKLMAKVYGHATLTITAGRSGDARNSFIANTYKQSAPCCEFPLGDGLGGNVLVGPLRSNDYGITETRGWCCQEKRLSRRVVFFGKEQLFFLCRSSGYSEDRSYQEGKSVLLHSFLKDGNGSPQSTRDRLLQYWDEIVVDFSRRQLSNPHDIFAALASIAEPISKALQSRYLADLWEDDLVRCLLWRPGYRVSSFFGPATRPLPTIFASAPVIRAPSWSWASIRWRQASHTPTISENEDREPKRNTIDKAEARPLDGRSSLWT